MSVVRSGVICVVCDDIDDEKYLCTCESLRTDVDSILSFVMIGNVNREVRSWLLARTDGDLNLKSCPETEVNPRLVIVKK